MCLALASSTAGMVADPGRLIPRASAAAAIVFAVYMPPQAPGPGQAWRSMQWSSSSPILPAAWAPTASKTLTMSSFRFS